MLKENLVMLRRIHGFSQEEISEKIGISRQAYAKWESGATIPDIEKCSLHLLCLISGKLKYIYCHLQKKYKYQ